MRHAVLDAIAWLASLEMQRRYIVHGSKLRYVVPEELLNDAFAVLQHVLAAPERSGLSSSERTKLSELLATLEAAVPTIPLDGSVSAASLIESDPSWIAVRAAAMSVLNALGFDLRDWERDTDKSVFKNDS